MKVDKTREWWHLVINLAGPGVELQLELESNNRHELMPPQRNVVGTAEAQTEKYGTADEFLEVRTDLVVAREITRGDIQEEKQPTGEGLKPPPSKEEQAEQQL